MTSHSAASEATEPARRVRRSAALRAGAALLVGIALAAAGPRLAAWTTAFLHFVEGLGPLAPFVFVLGYAAATVAFVPGTVLSLAAGALFGLVEGSVVVFTGATLGASAAFALARTVARDLVSERLRSNPRFEAVDRAVGEHGLKIVLLLRLSPAFPFNLLNYALGLTRVRFRDNLLGCLGMLPGTVLYVYLGTLAGEAAAVVARGGPPPERGPGYYAVLLLGLAATAAVTVLVTRIARRALAEATHGQVAA